MWRESAGRLARREYSQVSSTTSIPLETEQFAFRLLKPFKQAGIGIGAFIPVWFQPIGLLES